MKSLEHYKKLNYKMVIYYDREEAVFFVEFPELPGCIAEGNTAEEAVKNAKRVKNEWVKTALEAGWKIPEPTVSIETSGRLTLRLPKSIHKKLIDRSEEEGVSLNQLLLTYISEGLERISAKDYLEKAIGEHSSVITRLTNTIATSAPQIETLDRWELENQWSRIAHAKDFTGRVEAIRQPKISSSN